MGPFCLAHSIFLSHSDGADLYGNVTLSIVVLPTKRLHFSFSKKIFVFQKTFLRDKAFKLFKNSNNCYIEICQAPKRRAILKILSTVFGGT